MKVDIPCVIVQPTGYKMTPPLRLRPSSFLPLITTYLIEFTEIIHDTLCLLLLPKTSTPLSLTLPTPPLAPVSKNTRI